MYRLFGYIAGVKELDRSENEADIIETLGEYISKNAEICYSIVLRTPEQDIPYQIIHSIEDYTAYLKDYEKRQKEHEFAKVKKKWYDLGGF